MSLAAFNQTIDLWITALDTYSFEQLRTQPGSGRWSIGQVYMHLIDDTNFYIDRMLEAIASNDHANDDAIPFARRMLTNNDFPDEVIKGDPSHPNMPQPAGKNQLLDSLLNLRDRMNNAADQMAKSSFRGKSKHPGFDYLSADEWLQLSEMHLRHHLRQKKRIDVYLKG